MAKRKGKITGYTRNRNRINSYIRSQRSKGLLIDIYIPTEREVREQGIKGQQLSALTRELKKLTPSVLREMGEPFDVITGEIKPPVPQQPTASNEPDFKAPEDVWSDLDYYTDIVISNWFRKLEMFANGGAYTLLKNWAETIIAENGRNDFAEMIQKAEEGGNFLTWDIAYSAEQARTYIGSLIDYLPEAGILYKEKIMDKLDFMSTLDYELERYDGWEQI